LRETVSELQPVAQAKPGGIDLHCDHSLPVWAARPQMAGAVFRLLDSALSLALPGTVVQVTACRQFGQACLQVCWDAPTDASQTEYSRPELGLLVAEAAWKHSGGEWSRFRSQENANSLETTLARLTLAETGNPATTESFGGSR
jgi:hypothetical protein